MLSIFPNTTFQIFQIELSMFTMFYISTNIIKYTLAPHHNKSVLLDISILSSLANADGFFLGGERGRVEGASIFIFVIPKYPKLENGNE